MCTASLIHLVLLSDSLSKIVAADQLITWFSCDAWSVSADLFCSDRLDARWPLVKGLLVIDSTSVSCSFNLVPNFGHVSTDFLPHPITTVARTGRRIDHTSSDEGL